MHKRSIAIFIISFLIGFFHTPRKKNQVNHSDPMFFVGTWYFKDQHGHQHKLEIGPDLQLTVDGAKSSATVSSIKDYQVSYVDRYGYVLEVRANEARPILLYDESDNATYELSPTLEVSQHNQQRP